MARLTVAVRVRPLSDRELAAKSVSIVSVEDGKTIAVTNIKVPEQNAGDSRKRVRRFTFDYCFDWKSNQDDVYQNVGKEIAKAIQKRFHSCILAYGQSSTGKTHTMIGEDGEAGLAPRLCQNLFGYLEEAAIGVEAEKLNATVSYLEIYNEKVRDLLEPSDHQQCISLKVREHPKKGPYVQGLSEKTVLDSEELLRCLELGNANRTTASTNANRRSSRSHSVFTVTCCGGLKLRLVDLAGSERAGSRSHTTSRFREGANINKSLVALRNVISALAEGSRCARYPRKRFVPYRDSILTWLLKDTLGGNSKTILISTVSPSNACYNETVNTLRFGQRAKQIIVQPLVNEDPKERTIRELRAEIAKLKELLALTHVHNPKENEASQEGSIEWEEAEEFDSGLASSSASFDDDDDCFEVNEINNVDIHEVNVIKDFVEFQQKNVIGDSDFEVNSIKDLVGGQRKSVIVEDSFVETDDSINNDLIDRQPKDVINGLNNCVVSPDLIDKQRKSVINESIVENSFDANNFIKDKVIQDLLDQQQKSVLFKFFDDDCLEDLIDQQESVIPKLVDDGWFEVTGVSALNVLKTPDAKQKKTLTAINELIPVMEVNSDVNTSKPKTPLRRTFSMDHKEAKNSRLFGSHEVLSSGIIERVRKNTTSELRKRSVDRSMSSLLSKKNDKPTRLEKGVATDGYVRSEVKSKIDSYRKPRSQIVAAVTSRLYSKVKKKEASTETEDVKHEEPPKELSICSNARLRLQELTHKALKAHKRKSVDTQTDLFPVLRVKEISTDVDDLKIALEEVKDVETFTDCITTMDSSTNCSFLEMFNSDSKGGIIMTRTCGTSTENLDKSHLISFTKYLQSPHNIELVNPSTNPIFTSSVNINVNHNYINRNSDNSISDDSLEEHVQTGVCFPTPDLISNHNSLEQHAHELPKLVKVVRYASSHILPEENEACKDFDCKIDELCVAQTSHTQHHAEVVDDVQLESLYAPQTCTIERDEDDYKLFYERPPVLCRGKIVTDCLHEPIFAREATILKSIMKQQLFESSTSSDDESVISDFHNIPDSLNYYHEKKKVRFNDPPKTLGDDQMYSAMTSFMREVTTLMTNLTKVATRLEHNVPEEQSYDLELTVNAVHGLTKHKPKTRRRERFRRPKFNVSTESTQTSPTRTISQSTETQEEFPVNKYDPLVESSCDRLEKLVQKIESNVDLHKFPQPFSIGNDWNYRSNPMDDSSLESNPTFSDYGSLPRRKRGSSCSPSGYLRQLTNMRKQIVETSREDLLGEAHRPM